MKNLVKHVQNQNTLHKMWSDQDRVIVGVSGGPDSMCLLDVMNRIAQKGSLSIVVAHMNYGLRKKDADSDQEIVVKYAQKNDLPCETFQCQKGIKADEEHLRDMRYDFLMRVKEKYGARRIAVGHNKNDQAETFLLHLLRGSGLDGLVGMRFVSNRDIIRPLLCVERDEIIAYCQKHDITYHIDHTNNILQYTRNRVRNELLPLLKKNYNPQIVTVLARTAETLAEDLQYINSTQNDFYKKNASGVIVFSKNTFLSESIAMQRRILLMVMKDVRGTTKDIEKSMIDEMRKVIHSTKGKNQTFIGKDLKMVVKGDKVILGCA
jgi:tRNA(Ile)-lysidine synthase